MHIKALTELGQYLVVGVTPHSRVHSKTLITVTEGGFVFLRATEIRATEEFGVDIADLLCARVVMPLCVLENRFFHLLCGRFFQIAVTAVSKIHDRADADGEGTDVADVDDDTAVAAVLFQLTKLPVAGFGGYRLTNAVSASGDVVVGTVAGTCLAAVG